MSAVRYNVWDNPDRWVILGFSLCAALVFIALATAVLGSSLAGIILLDSATTQFVYPFTIQNVDSVAIFCET